MADQLEGDALLTPMEAARMLGFTTQALSYQALRGRVKPITRTGVRGDRLFSTSEIRRFLLERAAKKAGIAAKKKRFKSKRVLKNQKGGQFKNG